LKLDGLHEITDELPKIIGKFSELKILKLDGNRSLTDKMMEKICIESPNIISLSLVGCWNLKDPKILLNNLQELNLSRCESISTNELESIVKNHCDTIQLLNVAYCRNANAKIIQIISQKCVQLKSLDLTGLNIKSESIEPLFNNSNFLEYLNFSISFQLQSKYKNFYFFYLPFIILINFYTVQSVK
jgi:hypothetical protein